MITLKKTDPLFQGRMKSYSVEGTKGVDESLRSKIMEPWFRIMTSSEFLAAMEKEKE